MTALLESAETTALRFTWGDRVQVRDGEHADARGFVTDVVHRDGHRLLDVRLDDADGGELVTFAPAALVIPRRPVQDGLPPFTDERAEWIRVNVLNRLNGTLTPHIAGQRTCLHLPEPVCSGCRLGYHGACIGQSWGDLHATWIRDHSGSHLFWQDLGDECRVWVAPRPCECGCERRPDEPAVSFADEVDSPRSVEPAHQPAALAQEPEPVQLDIFAALPCPLEGSDPMTDSTLKPGDPIGVLDLSPCPHNALRRNGIHTIADLTACTPADITDIRNLGITFLGEIEAKLAARGLALRTEEPPES